jgi:hypothetical protein
MKMIYASYSFVCRHSHDFSSCNNAECDLNPCAQFYTGLEVVSCFGDINRNAKTFSCSFCVNGDFSVRTDSSRHISLLSIRECF